MNWSVRSPAGPWGAPPPASMANMMAANWNTMWPGGEEDNNGGGGDGENPEGIRMKMRASVDELTKKLLPTNSGKGSGPAGGGSTEGAASSTKGIGKGRDKGRGGGGGAREEETDAAGAGAIVPAEEPSAAWGNMNEMQAAAMQAMFGGGATGATDIMALAGGMGGSGEAMGLPGFAGNAMSGGGASSDALALMGMMNPPGESGTAPSGSGSGDSVADQQMAVWAATAAAQQTQYMQQFQFYQQLQVQEVQRRAQTSSQTPSRFKENFRPMRLCKHLLTLGFCRQGGDCTFGHSYDELHPASPDLPKDWVSPTAGTNALAEQDEIPESQVPDMRLKKKKEMCGRFSRGECSLGKICPFAHTEAELGTIGLSVCGKVKTRLCVFWDAVTQTSKGCIYGAHCNNAHGEREIGTKRPPPELAPPMKRRSGGENVLANRD